MTTGSFLNLADAASRLGLNGEQLYIAEMMSQSIVVLDDMPMRAASEFWGHDFSFRTSIPSGAWRQANQGTGYAKSTTGKLSVGLGVLEAPQEAQYKLDAALRKEFGDRYLCGYFLDCWYYQTSLCIRLAK